MNKTLTATLFILTSGLTLSVTAVAEPFNNGSGFVNANSNVFSSVSIPSTRSVQDVRRSGATPTASGFNMHSVVESEGYSAHSSAHSSANASIPIPNILTRVGVGFNDRS